MTTGKIIVLAIWTFVDKLMLMFSNTLSRFVIASLPKSQYLLISWLQSPSSYFGGWEKKIYHCFYFFPFYLHEVMGPERPWSYTHTNTCKTLTWFMKRYIWSYLFLFLVKFKYYSLRMYACSATWSCPTLWDPMDCNPLGFSVHEIFQARIPEPVSSSRGSSWPRHRTCVYCVFCIAGDSLSFEP